MAPPLELALTIVPERRVELIDVTPRVREAGGCAVRRYRRALYCSHHTTAGFLEQSVSSRLGHDPARLAPFIGTYRALFPADAGYRHDRLEERAELSEAERRVEPRNADSHLTFMAAGMVPCATYANREGLPVYLLELDGVAGDRHRTRRATVVLHDREEVVARVEHEVAVSRHPIDSVNLADPAAGLEEVVARLLERHPVRAGRVHVALPREERGAALTVNEYETLLMRHDLAEVLRDPLRFAADRVRSALRDPLAVPAKAVEYAKYDVVRILNELLDRIGAGETALERAVAWLMALPAERRLRFKRAVRLAVLAAEDGAPRLVRGRYQSPILIQWRPAPRGTRRVTVTLTRLV